MTDHDDLVSAAKDGSEEARGELIDAFTTRISHVADVFDRPAPAEREELVGAGVEGLLRAIDRYDPNLGTPFWAYASWWVCHAMEQRQRPIHLLRCVPEVLDEDQYESIQHE